jgi:AcrR family transcriptional regulator
MGRKLNIKRISKAEWLDAALNALEEGGIDAVRIERLAKKLGTSRSGFYWHFRSLENLKKDILEYWKYEFTDVVVQNYSTARKSPLVPPKADIPSFLNRDRHISPGDGCVGICLPLGR